MNGGSFWPTILEFGWHGNLPLLLLVVIALSLLLYRFSVESRATLKNTIGFLLFSLAGLFVAGLLHALDYPSAAKLLRTAFIFAQGVAVIRLAGLFFFRLLLELLNARPPSILEEIVVVIAYFIWIMVLLHEGGLNLGEIVTTSAVATAVLAFAMQDTLGNILGGLALQWDHSLKRGDWIRFGDVEGKIVDIRWRAILVETRNWETVVIPNSHLMKNQFKILGERRGQAVKWRRWIWFNIDYSVAPDDVINAAEEAIVGADIPGVASDPRPNCLMMDYDDSVARYALRYWLRTLDKDDPTDSLVRQHLYAALQRRGISPAVPRQHLHLTKTGEKFERHQHLEEMARRMTALGHVDLFAGFTDSEMRDLAESAEFSPYARGDLITRQGAVDHCLYVLTAGTVKICIQADDGSSRDVYRLGEGEFFGEHGMLTGKPRSASAIADSEVCCYRLNKTAFGKILMARPELVDELSHVLSSRLGVLDRARHELEEIQNAASSAPLHGELAARIRHFFGLAE